MIKLYTDLHVWYFYFMRKIALREMITKISIMSVTILVAASGITGCRATSNVSWTDLNDTAAAAQHSGSDSGSSQEEETSGNTSVGNENNSSGESTGNNQANDENETSTGIESSSQTGTGDKTSSESAGSNESSAENESAVASESSNESGTTVDENKILLTFVISGDNRPESNEEPQPEVFSKLLKYIKLQNPAFYINTGDVIMGNTENENVIKRQFSDYLDELKNLGVINFIAPGNHDVANDMSRKYFLEWVQKPAFDNAALADIEINPVLPGQELSGENSQQAANDETKIENDTAKNSFYYYFEQSGTYFVIINAYEKGYWGLVQGDQLLWLEQLLEKLKDKPVLIFMHTPPYSVLNPDCITDGSLHVGFSDRENQDNIRALFARYKVDAVFCGHEHLYDKQKHDGVEYIITGGSGSLLYAPADKGGFYHFIKVQVKTKSWTMDVIDSSGNKVYTEEILFN